MELPVWFDEQFLISIFEERYGKPIIIKNFTVTPAATPGNNYLSDVFRVKVEYEAENEQKRCETIIVKAPAITDFTTELKEKINFFAKESQLYANLFPKMFEKVNCEFGPKYYPCPVNDGLVLQDLNDEGYFMSNRVEQLDYPHCLKVVTKIAKFHASSVAVAHEDYTLVKALGKEIIFTTDGPVDDALKLGIEKSARNVAEITKDVEEYQEFNKFLMKRMDQLMENCGETLTARESKLNVLNHGDLWTTNILFKYSSSGDVEDVKFIDYQLTRFTSPVYDLIFFIWTSANNDVREYRLEDLYRAYLQTLNSNLAELGCEESMTLEELQEDFKAAVDLALILICHLLPIFVADPKDGIINLDDCNPADENPDSMNETRVNVFNGKYFRLILPHVIKQFVHNFL